MFLAVLCISSLVISICSGDAFKHQTIDHKLGKHIKDYSFHTREKRVSDIDRKVEQGKGYMIGILAEKKLLSGTVPSYSDAEYRTFTKQGDYSVALKDFDDVYPTNVQLFLHSKGNVVVGRVGDRKIMLLDYPTLGATSIVLKKLQQESTKMEPPILIIYSNHKKGN